MEQTKTKDKEDKSKDRPNPPNCYQVGNSWIVEFVFRGERYRESLGVVSRSMAKETAGRRKTQVADGDLLVNGKRWKNRQWITEIETPTEDPMFDTAMDRFMEFFKAENADYTYKKYAKPSSKNLKAFFGKYRISQISLVLIEKYKRDRKTICSCAGGPTVGEVRRKCGKCGHPIRVPADND